MKFKLGNYEVMTSPVFPKKIENAYGEETDKLKRDLDELSRILGQDVEWCLTGGVAIPLTLGSFYRIHRTIDVAVDESNFGALVSKARESNYGLFSRRFMTKVSSSLKLDFYREVLPEEVLKENLHHVKFLRLDKFGKPVNNNFRLDSLDVFLDHTEGEELVSDCGRFRIPRFRRGATYSTLSGVRINVRPLEYLAQVKEKRNSDIDKHDFLILSSYFVTDKVRK
ncbi:hypothetical protein HN832_05030 [archaeon]|jgi:hypothetical protein|nr:hypothetical protein [archaeon]MBT4373733.1 hypothetical protein [archaeon]MBT4532310.1 hypothetical protein [archaeon]MBT7001946.1 hypothetical protein [archaeon]MBT7282749.1 hypothetical protein [archaeon]